MSIMANVVINRIGELTVRQIHFRFTFKRLNRVKMNSEVDGISMSTVCEVVTDY